MKSKILANGERLNWLLNLSEDYLVAGKLDEFLAYAQSAAHFAWLNFCGEFRSPRLESMLVTAGLSLIDFNSKNGVERIANAPPSSSFAKRRVLHVLTKAPSFGGGPQLISNWICADHDSTHSLCLTSKALQIPAPLASAATETGGQIFFLGRLAPSLKERAVSLRALAEGFDTVVLHTHPFDIIPSIAFASPHFRPQVIFLNHADHVFWIGGEVADLIANIRWSGYRISTDKRGFSDKSNVILPIPILRLSASTTQTQAREELGIPASARVLLSIAAEYKYADIPSWSFLEDHVALLRRNPDVRMFVVGPPLTGRWLRAHNLTNGRLIALGPVSNLETYRLAADVAVDSYPFTSLTALLESMSAGLPAVSRSSIAGRLVTRFDDLAFHDYEDLSLGKAEYFSRIEALLADGEERQTRASDCRARVARIHSGDEWRRRLRTLYNYRAGQSLSIHELSPPKLPDATTALEEEMIYSIQHYGQEDYGLGLCLMYEQGNLSGVQRLVLIFRAFQLILMAPRDLLLVAVRARKKIQTKIAFRH